MTNGQDKDRADFSALSAYSSGARDTRPWGTWEVLETGMENGEEYCVKLITVKAGGVLSLQSHRLRREEWTVLDGTIEVTRADKRFTLCKGESTTIPLGTRHRMANYGSTDAVIHEIQRGICREDDIIRYEDIYGRG